MQGDGPEALLGVRWQDGAYGVSPGHLEVIARLSQREAVARVFDRSMPNVAAQVRIQFAAGKGFSDASGVRVGAVSDAQWAELQRDHTFEAFGCPAVDGDVAEMMRYPIRAFMSEYHQSPAAAAYATRVRAAYGNDRHRVAAGPVDLSARGYRADDSGTRAQLGRGDHDHRRPAIAAPVAGDNEARDRGGLPHQTGPADLPKASGLTHPAAQPERDGRHEDGVGRSGSGPGTGTGPDSGRLARLPSSGRGSPGGTSADPPRAESGNPVRHPRAWVGAARRALRTGTDRGRDISPSGTSAGPTQDIRLGSHAPAPAAGRPVAARPIESARAATRPQTGAAVRRANTPVTGRRPSIPSSPPTVADSRELGDGGSGSGRRGGR